MSGGETVADLEDLAPVGYLTTTADGTIVTANRTFLGWTGHVRDDLVGRRTFASLLTAGGRIYHETHVRPLLHMTGQVRELALDVVTAGNERLPVLMNASLARGEDGTDGLVRIVVFDATERRQYERELLLARQRAEESEARARALVRTLQDTFIPPADPVVPGLLVGTAYRPAGTGLEIGGDFYDVFQVGDGDWVVALGDVCGKGADAAVVTALVRHTIRATAVVLTSPAAVLEALNDVLLHHETDRFCTLVVLRLRLIDDGWDVVLAAGGHPPPVLVRPSGPPRPVECGGPLIGVLEHTSFDEARLHLTAGSTVLLYTDGVTEGRRGRDFYGEPGLVESVRRHGPDPLQLAHGLLADVMEYQSGLTSDDVAVVAVGVPPTVT